ncbi:MAG: GNAT family N-acetyltransferase [Planctomycetota bacterium]
MVIKKEEKEEIVGMGQYAIVGNTHSADVALVVRDDYQNRGIGTELVSYLTYLAKKQGLLGFTADILVDNKPMLYVLRLFEQMGFEIEKKMEAGVFELKIAFRER